MFRHAVAAEKEKSQRGFVKVGEIAKIASKAHETIKKMPRSVKVFMLGLGGSMLVGCSTEIPGMAAKADAQAGKKAEKPGIEQVAAQYTKEVKELIAGDPIYEARDGSKVTAKVFAKSMNVDGSDRVLVHVEALSYEGHKGNTQYVGLLNSFGTQDGSAQGYLSLHEAPFDPKSDQATGSKAIVTDMNYFVDATDVQNGGVQLFLTRDSSSILREVLSLQDSGGLKKCLPTEFSFHLTVRRRIIMKSFPATFRHANHFSNESTTASKQKILVPLALRFTWSRTQKFGQERQSTS